jgi:pimeloyl-ACP methyl ester carboxylesterase
VLVHGATGHHEDWPQAWRQAVKTLSSSEALSVHASLSAYPVYALDLPGHGRSDPPSRNSIGDYAQDVLNFVEALGLGNVIIAGYSLGGAIAQAIGVQRPSSLAGLILIGTGARLPVNELILNGLRTDFPGTAELIMKFAWHKTAPSDLKQQAIQRLLKLPPEVVYGNFYACNEFDLSDRLDQINVPTLVIDGSDDKMTPLSYSQFLVEHIPNAQLVAIETAGHSVALEKTAEVTEAIIRFLEENF